MGEVVQFDKVAQEEMRQDLRSVFLGAIRLSLELLLEEELKAMVGARRYERIGSRKDHRNGTCVVCGGVWGGGVWVVCGDVVEQIELVGTDRTGTDSDLERRVR